MVMWVRALGALLGPRIYSPKRGRIYCPAAGLGFDKSVDSSFIVTRGKAEYLVSDAGR